MGVAGVGVAVDAARRRERVSCGMVRLNMVGGVALQSRLPHLVMQICILIY